MTTVQAACFSKNMIRSLLRSLRLTSVAPASSTAWTWNTDFAVSRPIMAMLIAGDSFSAGPHDRHRQGAVHPILVKTGRSATTAQSVQLRPARLGKIHQRITEVVTL